MFALWVLPALVVPLIVFVLAQAWPVAVMVSLAFLIWMGTVHAGDPVQDQWGTTPPRWPKVLLYVVVQVVLIPLLWVAFGAGILRSDADGKILMRS